MSSSARSAKLRNGTWGFRLRASSFCSGAKGTKRPPGAAHGHLQCPIPPPPDPHLIYGGATKGQGYIHPARAKDRTPFLAPPAAAPCWSNKLVLLQERSRLLFRPRGAVWWSLCLRGWCRMHKDCRKKRICFRSASSGGFGDRRHIPARKFADYRQPPGGYIR